MNIRDSIFAQRRGGVFLFRAVAVKVESNAKQFLGVSQRGDGNLFLRRRFKYSVGQLSLMASQQSFLGR